MNAEERISLLGVLADRMVGVEVAGFGEVLSAELEQEPSGGTYMVLTFNSRQIRVDALLWSVLKLD